MATEYKHKTIQELESLSTFTGGEYLPVTDGSTTKRVAVSTIVQAAGIDSTTKKKIDSAVQPQTLEDAVKSLVKQTDFNSLKHTVDGLPTQSDITALQTSVGAKADSAEVNRKVAELQTTINTKASTEQLNTLTATVNTKVDAAHVASAISTAVQSLETTKADKSQISTLQSLIQGKADQSALTDLESKLGEKVGKSELQVLQTELNLKATQSSLSDVEAKVYANTESLKTTQASINAKADKTTTDDLTSQLANKANIATVTAVSDALANKVDKVSGKGLSANDFTDALKTKLEGLSTGSSSEKQLPTDNGDGQVAAWSNAQQKWIATTYPQGSVNYDISRGSGLITNGTGYLKSNYNFSSFVFDPSDTFAGYGCFKTTGLNQTIALDEPIPVDLNGEYEFSFAAKMLEENGTTNAYSFVECLDIDGESITPAHVVIATFKLTKELKSTDTSVTMSVADATALQTTLGARLTSSANIRLGDGEYTSKTGFKYPTGAYTRTWFNQAVASRATTLNTTTGEWTGFNFSSLGSKVMPVGTTITVGQDGATFIYWVPDLIGGRIPQTWTTYRTRRRLSDILRPYTALVRIGWLCNRGGQRSTTAFSNIQFRQVETTAPVARFQIADNWLPAELRGKCELVANILPSCIQYEFKATAVIAAAPNSSVANAVLPPAYRPTNNGGFSLLLPRGGSLNTDTNGRLVYFNNNQIPTGDTAHTVVYANPFSVSWPTGWTRL